MRDVGGIETLQSALPEVAVGIASALTHLGDPAVLVALTVALYWRACPDAGRLFAAALGAVGLVLALKGLLALPRPSPALQAPPADGYGFPSGHATGATVVYGGLALAHERWSTRIRLAGAGAVVTAVALSRVVIGVHYVADVVAGVLVGTAFLLGVWRLSRDRVAPAFWLAVTLGTAGVAFEGSPDAVLGFGTALGATVAWGAVADASRSPVAYPVVAAAAVGLGAVVAVPRLFAAAPPLLWVSGAVTGASIVALPAAAR
jgi:membrane-associated phospholipid phosphatase